MIRNEPVYMNKWMSVNRQTNPNGESFYYFKEPDKVVILPYFYYLEKPYIVCFLEPVSTWGRDKEVTALTGTVEDSDSPEKTAVRELEEEAGVIVPFDNHKWVDIGELNVSKSLTSHRYHYLVDIGDSDFGKRNTDGSYFEKNTKMYTVPLDTVQHSNDLSFHYLVLKLKEHLNIY